MPNNKVQKFRRNNYEMHSHVGIIYDNCSHHSIYNYSYFHFMYLVRNLFINLHQVFCDIYYFTSDCPASGVRDPPKTLSSSDQLLSRCSQACSYHFPEIGGPNSGDVLVPGELPLVSSDYHLFLCIHICNLHLRRGRLCPNY